jgi:hypothetical protein
MLMKILTIKFILCFLGQNALANRLDGGKLRLRGAKG